MLRIITLLNQKNHYLEKFYSLNETELLNFSAGNFNNLESFYQTREKILGLIKYLDEEIDGFQDETLDMSIEFKAQAREAMNIKDEYVNRIIGQDLEILACIESAKSTIIRELQEIKQSKSLVGKYKSKTFNRRLDEEV